MTLADLVRINSVVVGLKAGGKKQLFHDLAGHAAKLTGLDARAIFDAVLERERLGSTGVGSGVAIPHARIESLEAVVGVFARLDQAIDFDAIDDEPADLVFLLLAPEGAGADHLKALARVSRLFRRADMRKKLRAAPSADAVHALLASEPQSDAA